MKLEARRDLPVTPAKRPNNGTNDGMPRKDAAFEIQQEWRRVRRMKEDENHYMRARVQTMASSTKSRITIPMLGKGSKIRRGGGEDAGILGSKREIGSHLVTRSQKVAIFPEKEDAGPQ